VREFARGLRFRTGALKGTRRAVVEGMVALIGIAAGWPSGGVACRVGCPGAVAFADEIAAVMRMTATMRMAIMVADVVVLLLRVLVWMETSRRWRRRRGHGEDE